MSVFERQHALRSCRTPEEWNPIYAEMFAYMDKDQDGKVSLEEHNAYSAEFSEWFINQTPEAEREAIRAKTEAAHSDPTSHWNPTVIFKQCDVDGDGFLTLEELTNGYVAMTMAMLKRMG